MLSVVWVIAAVAGITYGAPGEPRPCCYDKEFTANIGDVGAVGLESTGDALFIDLYSQVSRDYYRDREVSISNYRQHDGSYDTRTQLKDYITRTSYITYSNGSCISSPLQPYDWLYDTCIPDDARYGGQIQFGYGHNIMNAHVWRYPFPSTAMANAQIIMTVTQQHCVPITQVVVGNFNGVPVHLTLFYADYHPGIPDTAALDLPTTDCHPASPSAGRG